uniref:NADH-ubiquinone oxidoreductase chain 2 n=1 Tax=Curculionoidea sp. 30 KM-2017 TaxID=2219415 RepID=A0A346RJ84_9CUCU|nr:NADH dehydrogenase subunit 2 [Curculionoidea sp. 30 KM-2017]
MKKSFKILFLLMLVISTLISISSTSWLMIWVGLEINLLSIIPMMKKSNNSYSAEASIKYFMIQAIASVLFLSSIMAITSNIHLIMEESFSLSSKLALLLKMGAAPFHSWLPEVVSGLKWEMILIMLTWQKIAPMIIISYLSYTPMFLSIFIIFSALISGIQGLNQICLRKILAYSSINHMSWMISAMLSSTMLWTYYFIIYSIISWNMIIIFMKFNIFNLNQLANLFSFNKKVKIFFMLNFLSLSGLPPFLGFYPKWLTINFLIKNNFMFLSMILIMLTLTSMYMYIRITFSSFSIKTKEALILIFHKTNFMYMFSNFLALTSITICILTTGYL